MQDVNKLVGWAIFCLRHGKICMLSELVEDGTEKQILLQKQINFLESMTFRKEEAILNEECRMKCHDSFFEAWDRGRLTLVNEKHFDFGFQLVKLVATSFSRKKLEKDITSAASATKKS